MSETTDQTSPGSTFESTVSHIRAWRGHAASNLRRLEGEEISLQAKLDTLRGNIDRDRALIAELDAAATLLEEQGR